MIFVVEASTYARKNAGLYIAIMSFHIIKINKLLDLTEVTR